MSEWWTYSLSDFLLFSPHTYYRLFELYNAAIWPAQILALALGLAILVLLRAGFAGRDRIVAAVLAAAWLWVAEAYLLERYDTINWAARYFAIGFAIEALLLVNVGLILGQLRFRPTADAASRVGVLIFLFALLAQPLVGLLVGRPWTQLETFGIAPDPTAIGTLGLLLAARGWASRLLMVIPLVWCLITGLTLWTMASPDALVVPVAALLALLLAAWRAASRPRP
jgi:hypothetical protein